MEPPPSAELAPFVREVFGCPDEVALTIVRSATERTWPARAVIIPQGDDCAETYLLVAGRARALAYRADGQYVLLHEYGPGELFGAMAEARSRAEAAEVSAVEQVRAAVFLALDFLRLVEGHSCIALALTRMLMERLRIATGMMVEQVTLSAPGRVYAALLKLADGKTGVICDPPTVTGLAEMVQSTRETVSRTINALERRGVIRREAGTLVIVAPGRLREMVV